MEIDLSVRDPDGTLRDIRLSAAAGTPTAELLAAVGATPAGTVPQPDTLRHGVILGDAPAGVESSTWRLAVCGGPDAGLTYPLPPGATVLGRDSTADLQLHDPDVSRTHAEVVVTGGRVRVADRGSTNGCVLDGVPVPSDGAELRPGSLLRLGDTLLRLETGAVAPADVRPLPDGRLLVNPPPAAGAPPEPAVIELPVPPQQPRFARVPVLAALIPAAGAGALALWSGSATFLLLAVLSPLALLTGAVGDRWHGRRGHRRSTAEHRRAVELAEHRIQVALAQEAAVRRDELPDAAAAIATAGLPGRRLWERRRSPEGLRVRVGVADLPARLRVLQEGQPTPAGTVRDVPVPVDLADGPLGLSGPRESAAAVARWCVAQLAVALAPADLQIVPLCEGSEWRWLRWLPHVRGEIAAGTRARRALLRDLLALADLREERRTVRGGTGWTGPWLLLVLDEDVSAADLPELGDLLDRGPRVGFTAICLQPRRAGLPAACVTIAEVGGDNGNRLTLLAAGTGVTAVADRIAPERADSLARALAPLVDPRDTGGWGLPDVCPLPELLGAPDPERLRQAWTASAAAENLTAPLGVGDDGPLLIDLVADGPHALVAGTTGSGKSELLRSWVLALATGYPPTAVQFLLIDYKGGAAFAECAGLPHTSGTVTDLDPALVQRALVSLRAELRRREEILAVAGAADLPAYLRSGAPEPVPRLVIVVDEFAGLAEDLPEFVGGLVGIAQRGRSLGIHLILATQRPGGVVSADIRANTALRVCLRVTSPGDSGEVLDSPVAAQLSPAHPGRAYVRRGQDLIAMQVASSAHPANPDGAPDAATTAIDVVQLDPWRRPVGVRRGGTHEPDVVASAAGTRTTLADWVAAIRSAAAGERPGRPLWLPPLPDLITPRDLPDPSGPAAGIALGLIDLPGQQRQEPFLIDLRAGGGLLVAGGPRSGRTGALFGLALGAAGALAPDALHLHAIDGGSGLAGLASLPHTGTLVDAAQHAVVESLLEHLDEQVSDRLSEPRADDPLLLLLVDVWERFVDAALEHGHGRSTELLESLLRRGAAAGLTVAIAGGRDVLAPRLAGAVPRRLVLPLADPGDYALAGIAARDVPAHRPPGRALLTDGTQVQLVRPGPRDAADAAAAHGNRTSRPPLRLRPLPRRVRLEDLPARTSSTGPAPTTLWLGLGGGTAAPVGIDPFAGAGRLLVAGPPRSGRSTLLGLLAAQSAPGVRLVLAAPVRSPLARSPHRLGVPAGTPLLSPPTPAADLARTIGAAPTLLLIDDCEAFLDAPSGDTLAALLADAGPGLAVVVAGRNDTLAVTHRGLAAEARRFGCGVLLQPTPIDGDLVCAPLPRQHSTPARIPGRGLVVPDPEWPAGPAGIVPLQVALPPQRDPQSSASNASSSCGAYQDSSNPSASSTTSCADSSPRSAASIAPAAAATADSASPSSMWTEAS